MYLLLLYGTYHTLYYTGIWSLFISHQPHAPLSFLVLREPVTWFSSLQIWCMYNFLTLEMDIIILDSLDKGKIQWDDAFKHLAKLSHHSLLKLYSFMKNSSMLRIHIVRTESVMLQGKKYGFKLVFQDWKLSFANVSCVSVEELLCISLCSFNLKWQ